MHWSIWQILSSFVADKCKVLHMGKNNEQRCYRMRKHESNDRVTLEKSEIKRDKDGKGPKILTAH